jgi:CRISPR-associated protein Csm3
MSEIKIEGKIIILGEIELLSGLHIGSGGQNGIGLVDSPVVRHPLTDEPYIPGSSLKGRLRYSLDILTGTESAKVKYLFGTVPNTEKSKTRCTSRIYIRDAHLNSDYESNNITEIKYENTIDRLTGTTRKGGLRQIERVVAGTRFDFEVVYCIEDSYKEDLENLEACFKFLEDEYLGASGSRGYGKVKFHFKEIAFRSLDYYKDNSNNNELKISTEDGLSPWADKASDLIEGNKSN